MKIDNKLILEYSKRANLLYVEDDEALRNSTQKIFKHYFKQVDTAIDGKDGLEKFIQYNNDNDAYYDLVISDINMPNMSGIDMSKVIMNENPEQSIVFITAHNEASFLHEAIKIGINGFLTKPVEPDQLKYILYRTTQAVCNRKLVDDYYKQIEDLNIKLQEQTDQILEDKLKLEGQMKLFETHVNAVDTKHQQVEMLLQQIESEEPLLNEYFAKDEDEGAENVIFLKDDCDEISEIFADIPELLMQYSINHDLNNINQVVDQLKKVSSILLRYTPFLDPLAKSFDKLSHTINSDIEKFLKMLDYDLDSIIALYDAIGIDMDRYTKRFSIETMAMKNIHHIHHPTTLSIKQIIGSISPENIDEGEIEFFLK